LTIVKLRVVEVTDPSTARFVQGTQMKKLRHRLIWSLCAFIACVPAFSDAQQSAVKEIKVSAGQTVDLWLGVNVSGKLNYVVRTKDGNNGLRMWWIIQPLGRVKQLGTRNGAGTLTIPDKLQGSISAKLRGKATVDTIVAIGENVAVDSSLTFHW
jgi:hypothetical protein